MKGFILGVIVASLAWGGFFAWQRQRLAEDSVAEDAAEGDEGEATGKQAKGKRKRPARRWRRPRAGAEADRHAFDDEVDEPRPIDLGPGDVRNVARGADLNAPDVLKLDMGEPDDGARELGEDEIDEVFRRQQERILACIQSARPDAITYIPGRVTIGFRIRRTGEVRGVRIEAPAILQKGGLYECVVGVVNGMRFRPSSGSQVVSYPFRLS